MKKTHRSQKICETKGLRNVVWFVDFNVGAVVFGILLKFWVSNGRGYFDWLIANVLLAQTKKKKSFKNDKDSLYHLYF